MLSPDALPQAVERFSWFHIFTTILISSRRSPTAVRDADQVIKISRGDTKSTLSADN